MKRRAEDGILKPEKGMLLISEPFLNDPNFHRSVVLLTEHNEHGSVGLVLDQISTLKINDLFDDIESENPVYVGGPVSRNSLLFIHALPGIPDSEEVMPGIYWGGDFEMLKFQLNEKIADDKLARFFAGYSGWAPGQLEAELEQKSWIVANAIFNDIFSPTADLWKRVLRRQGPEFSYLGNAPEDVSLN
jgi:putative transcriptional regulator